MGSGRPSAREFCIGVTLACLSLNEKYLVSVPGDWPCTYLWLRKLSILTIVSCKSKFGDSCRLSHPQHGQATAAVTCTRYQVEIAYLITPAYLRIQPTLYVDLAVRNRATLEMISGDVFVPPVLPRVSYQCSSVRRGP